MFEHLNLEFDLTGKKVIAETAAKDYHGVPIYQYIYDAAAHQSTEIVNISADVPESAFVAPITTPSEPTQAVVPFETAVPAATAAATEVVSHETTSAEAASEIESTTSVNENGDRVLTLEEQREVAFKVVFFFMMLILASFAILYIYYRSSQKKDKKGGIAEQ